MKLAGLNRLPGSYSRKRQLCFEIKKSPEESGDHTTILKQE
jgi:hypothetical protein